MLGNHLLGLQELEKGIVADVIGILDLLGHLLIDPFFPIMLFACPEARINIAPCFQDDSRLLTKESQVPIHQIVLIEHLPFVPPDAEQLSHYMALDRSLYLSVLLPQLFSITKKLPCVGIEVQLPRLSFLTRKVLGRPFLQILSHIRPMLIDICRHLWIAVACRPPELTACGPCPVDVMSMSTNERMIPGCESLDTKM